jgi:hypothetical protein
VVASGGARVAHVAAPHLGPSRTDQRWLLELGQNRAIFTLASKVHCTARTSLRCVKTLRRCSHKDYLRFQRKDSFAAPLGLLHQQCVHRWAMQTLTAMPQSALTHALEGHSDAQRVEQILAWSPKAGLRGGAAGLFLCSMLASQTWGHGNRRSAADSLQECYCTMNPRAPKPSHDSPTP